MKKLKILFVTMFLLFSATVFSQVNRFNAYEYNYKLTDKEWVGREACNIPVVINATDGTIKIYNTYNQSFKVTEVLFNGYDNDGDYVVKFYCIDNRSVGCYIRLIKRTSGINQIYVDYTDITYVYNLQRIDAYN